MALLSVKPCGLSGKRVQLGLRVSAAEAGPEIADGWEGSLPVLFLSDPPWKGKLGSTSVGLHNRYVNSGVQGMPAD